MPQINNPAGRLHKIILQGRKHSGEIQAIEVWGKILSVPNSDKSELLRRIGLILSLPSEISEKVSCIDNINSSVYLKWIPKVEQAFSSLNFQIQWKQFMVHFDPSVEYGMEICSDILSREMPEKIAKKEQLNEIKEQIDDLIIFIEKEKIEPTTKQFIVKSLHSILRSLVEVNISGLSSVEKEFNSIIGSVVVNNHYQLDSSKSEVATKFWKIITGLSLILSISANAIMIEEKIVNFLPENSVTAKQVPKQNSDIINI